jgi:hypothetical protein
MQRNLARWRELSPEERERLRDLWRSFELLSPEERERLRNEALGDRDPP